MRPWRVNGAIVIGMLRGVDLGRLGPD